MMAIHAWPPFFWTCIVVLILRRTLRETMRLVGIWLVLYCASCTDLHRPSYLQIATIQSWTAQLRINFSQVSRSTEVTFDHIAKQVWTNDHWPALQGGAKRLCAFGIWIFRKEILQILLSRGSSLDKVWNEKKLRVNTFFTDVENCQWQVSISGIFFLIFLCILGWVHV